MIYDGAEYFYIYNLQGDILGLLDANGTQVVSYSYNSWGKILFTEDTTFDRIGGKNPFRYRGYMYDGETGWYYIGSRYYDPETGRFISPDTTDILTVSPMDLTDKNLYAYCDDNPVVRMDANGQIWVASAFNISISFVMLAVETMLTGERPTNGDIVWCFVAGVIGVGARSAAKYSKHGPRVVNGLAASVESILSGGDLDDCIVAFGLGFATGDNLEIEDLAPPINKGAEYVLGFSANVFTDAYAEQDQGKRGIMLENVVNWWNTPIKKADLNNLPTYGINGVGKAPEKVVELMVFWEVHF